MAPGIVVAGASIMSEQLIPAVRDDIIPAVKDGIISIVKEQFRGVWYLEDDIGKISERVKTYRGVKEIAEKRQFENREAREWLSDLKNVLYDVEDVLCEYRDGVVRAEEDDQGVLTQWMMHAKDGLSLLLCGIPLSCLKDVLRLPLTPRVEIAQRLRSINANLTKVEERRQRLASLADESSDNLGATPLWEYEDQPMIGRDEIKAQIKHVLLKHAATCIEGSTCSKLLVIGIVGVGGMGKTTLAHSIYNDEDVMAAFDFKKWFYVGEKFELKEIMNNIIGNESQLQNEDELRSAMIKKLREQSVLIILDETWCSNSDEWKLLGSSLSKGAKTCVLITTTRNKTVAKAINHESQYYEYELARVSNDTCMQIFKRWAFMGTNAGRSAEFKGFSEEVVEKMKGVPLAAKIIGRLLYNHLGNRQKWIDIVKDIKWLDTEEGNVIDKITGLTYYHLPPHLRPCFTFCAIFPKGQIFEKEDLVRMWIGQGYIQSQGTELMEHIGITYFEDLHQRSLFQLVNDDFGTDIPYYMMHDLIHDFTQKLFIEGCRVNRDQHTTINELSHSTRHLSFKDTKSCSSSIRPLNVCKKLHTLVCEVTFSNIKYVFANEFRYLRLLIINCHDMEKVPDPIRHLKLLRYLNVSQTRIKSLTETICDLINLEFLILPYDLIKLPVGMSKLVKLRCLKIMHAKEVPVRHVKDIGKLSSLQGCKLGFTVLNENGWRISELKDLNHLHGTLNIYGLKHVKSRGEAEQVCLKEKMYLEKLKLSWDVPRSFEKSSQLDSHVNVQSQVLESLTPPPFLVSLEIDYKNYEGVLQLPRWMHNLPSTLVELILYHCHSWESLPTLGQLQLLKRLEICGLKNVREIGPEFYGDGDDVSNSSSRYFPRLEEIILLAMDSLSEWKVPQVREQINDDNTNEESKHVSTSSMLLLGFPSLTFLRIEKCPKLRTLSAVLPHLTSLEKMDIKRCNQLTSLVELNGGGCNGPLFPSLNHLSISGCPKLIPASPLNKADNKGNLGGLYSLPPTLKTLKIECASLNEGAQVSRWIMHNLPSTLLVEIQVEINGEDQSAPLMSHENEGCWEHLPALGQLPSLKRLTIRNIHDVREIGPEFYCNSYNDGGDERAADHNIANKTTEDGEGTSSSSIITKCYFPRLEEFTLSNMVSLEEWMMPPVEEQINHDINHYNVGDDDDDDDDDNEEGHHIGRGDGCKRGHRPQLAPTSSSLLITVFPSLATLHIHRCLKLRTLSSVLPHLTALRSMEIACCPELRSLVGGDGASNDDHHRYYSFPPSLEYLKIVKCPFLEARLREGSIAHPKIPTIAHVEILE